MAARPVFISMDSGGRLIEIRGVEFSWFPGMSLAQKRRSIEALHAAAVHCLDLKGPDILEVSRKSPDELGESLSAFNLTFTTRKLGRTYCVESAYQGSKVFEGGGPFTDILGMDARSAKRDERLRKSGDLREFSFYGRDWSLRPVGAFYSWLYINALNQPENRGLADAVMSYSAFTDIEFNPKNSYSCQALAVALYVALRRQGRLEQTLSSVDEFLDMMKSVPDPHSYKNGEKNRGRQEVLLL